MSNFCKHCGAEISDARFCPNCGKPSDGEQPQTSPNQVPARQKKKHGCLKAFLGVVIAFIVLFAGVTIFFAQNSAIQGAVSGNTDSSQYMTMEEFNKIETDMTYDEVKEIVGSGGEVSSQAGSGQYQITIITWYGNGVAGSNANVTFTNGKVSGKAQVGLK